MRDPGLVGRRIGGALAGAVPVGDVVGDEDEQGLLPAGLGDHRDEAGDVIGAGQPACLRRARDRL